jgi:uncharacterized membrane protein YoaK (UPF0700 family)
MQYVDTAGFLALQGLFTAHVTGNFVTLGAALVFGTSGVIAKLVALPVFCVVVMVSRLLGTALSARGKNAASTLLFAKVVLLAIGAALAIRLGPFTNGDGWPAIVTGMVLVAAMAIQNAVQRIHLSSAPPTTMMTGTTTQIMIDLADFATGQRDAAMRIRFRRMAAAVVAFAIGCALAAILYASIQTWCFALPPVLGLAAFLIRIYREPAEVEAARAK